MILRIISLEIEAYKKIVIDATEPKLVEQKYSLKINAGQTEYEFVATGSKSIAHDKKELIRITTTGDYFGTGNCQEYYKIGDQIVGYKDTDDKYWYYVSETIQSGPYDDELIVFVLN